MATNNSILRTIIDLALKLFSGSKSKASTAQSRPRATLNPGQHAGSLPKGSAKAGGEDASVGQFGDSQTIEIDPPAAGKLTISYRPKTDGDPDAGEVIWTWIPYEENDGRGKDRPVLVIGRHSADRVYVVRLTSKSHQGDRDFLAIGSGPWDSQGRPSWVDIDQLYTVHKDGMRREASTLDLKRFSVVADALVKRYGWKVAGMK